MKTPEQWLKQIERLRAKHTEAFKAEKWPTMQTIGDKIKTAWEGYHGAVKANKK